MIRALAVRDLNHGSPAGINEPVPTGWSRCARKRRIILTLNFVEFDPLQNWQHRKMSALRQRPSIPDLPRSANAGV